MAVRLESTIKRYIGGAGDVKPRPGITLPDGILITAAELPVGSSFLEEDTGLISRWTGVNWTVALPEMDAVSNILLAEILHELRATREEARTGLPVD